MIDLLQYTFFQHAIIGSLLISIACACIGTYIVSRRLVFISGGITHSSFAGIGLALYMGISPTAMAAVTAVASAFAIEWISKRTAIRQDSAIALLWTLGMTIGILFSFMAPGYSTDLSTYLFGSILTITESDLWILGVLTIALCLWFMFFNRPILYISFDAEFARTSGIPVALFEYILMAFTALTIVACTRLVGIVLAMSMLTIPQMTANLFSNRFNIIMLASVPFGLIACVGGLFVSYNLQVPSGAAIIILSILIYAVCRLIKSRL